MEHNLFEKPLLAPHSQCTAGYQAVFANAFHFHRAESGLLPLGRRPVCDLLTSSSHGATIESSLTCCNTACNTRWRHQCAFQAPATDSNGPVASVQHWSLAHYGFVPSSFMTWPATAAFLDLCHAHFAPLAFSLSRSALVTRSALPCFVRLKRIATNSV